jgi:serine/threonine protein kinase
VLDNDELEHCETLAIPSSEIVVGAFIGRGACGDVMRGAWRGRSVAIKTLCAATCEPGTQESKDMIKEIALMCRSFSTVRHAAIVDFYGICTDGLQPWLIIEYVGGGSVESFMTSQGPDYQPTRRQALTWALDLARGLEHLHAQRPACNGGRSICRSASSATVRPSRCTWGILPWKSTQILSEAE